MPLLHIFGESFLVALDNNLTFYLFTEKMQKINCNKQNCLHLRHLQMQIIIITFFSAAKMRIREVLNDISTPNFGINQSLSNDSPPIQSAYFGEMKTVDKKYGRDLFRVWNWDLSWKWEFFILLTELLYFLWTF